MSSQVALVFSALIVLAVSKYDFLQFTKEYGKEYASIEEFNTRQGIFERNYQAMVEHNLRYGAGKESWSQRVTRYYDLTQEETNKALGLTAMPEYPVSGRVSYSARNKTRASAPDSVDWVAEGLVTPAKDRNGGSSGLSCGSSPVFSTISIIETCFASVSPSLPDLSEQQLVDCADDHEYHDDHGTWHAEGCNGGWPQPNLDWLLTKTGGVVALESCYPYTGRDGKICQIPGNCVYKEAYITGMQTSYHQGEWEMKQEVAINPVSTNMRAGSSLHHWAGGVWDGGCSDSYNLEMAVVGYGFEGNTPYWLVKPAWGPEVGENGFFKIKRGKNLCGVGYNHFTSVRCAPMLRK